MKSTTSRPILSTSVARRVDAHSQSKPSFKDAKKAKLPKSLEFTSESLRDEAGKVRRAALRDARLASPIDE